MIRIVVRDTGHTHVRVLSYRVISAMSTGAEVTLNLISAVLRYCIIINLTLEASHNITFSRIDINIVILTFQKYVISYDKIDLS